jgi:hypothetical protein
MPVRKYDILQVGTGLTFLFKLSKSLHLYILALIYLPNSMEARAGRVMSLDTNSPTPMPTPQSPHDDHILVILFVL